MVKLYLAHPLDARKEIRKIELICEKETELDLMNPLYDIHREDVVDIDAGIKSRFDESLDFVAIVNRDLYEIYDSDGVVAFIGEVPSMGTCCEIWYALSIGRSIYVISEKFLMHPWIRYVLKVSNGKGFKNWKEFTEYFKVPQNENRKK